MKQFFIFWKLIFKLNRPTTLHLFSYYILKCVKRIGPSRNKMLQLRSTVVGEQIHPVVNIKTEMSQNLHIFKEGMKHSDKKTIR